MEPPVWAPAGVDQWKHGVWEGAGAARQWGATARPGPGGCAARRARFSREAAAAVEEEVEDVGHARTGGGAGSERAAGQPGAAAGRLRRYGGARVRAPGCPGATLKVSKPTRGRGWNRPRRRRPVPEGLPEEGSTPDLENISWD